MQEKTKLECSETRNSKPIEPGTETLEPETSRPKEKEHPKGALIGMNTFTLVSDQPRMELYFITMEKASTAHLANQETVVLDPDPELSQIP